MAHTLQFVVQHHNTGTACHWDLMLEQPCALATWHVPIPPERIAHTPLPVERMPDHPKRFLTYQGPLRHHPGSVRIHDRGTYALVTQSENSWRISIVGRHLSGIFQLDRTSGQDPTAWQIARLLD